MKNTVTGIGVFLAIVFLNSLAVIAAEKKDEAWVRKLAFEKASEYARSISCETYVAPKDLVALVPWKNFNDIDERQKARYALIWHGDIGCMGGSGTYNPYIAIIGISTGDSFVVLPMLSSPAIEFEVPVHVIGGIKKVTKSELTLIARDWGPDDAHCCPSVPVTILLREDEDGNWRFVKKEVVKR